MDDFLEQQIRKIRELTKRMSQVQRRTAELCTEPGTEPGAEPVEIARARDHSRRSPLDEVRDLRPISHPSFSRRRRRR